MGTGTKLDFGEPWTTQCAAERFGTGPGKHERKIYMNETSHMSKKAAIAGVAITAIATSDDCKAQAFIAGVAVLSVVVQGVLDWHKKGGRDE